MSAPSVRREGRENFDALTMGAKACGSNARADLDHALSRTARRGRGIDDRSGHRRSPPARRDDGVRCGRGVSGARSLPCVSIVSRKRSLPESTNGSTRVQAILSGRVPSTAPRKRAHPDFPLRGFVRCESCGRGLTGSWSKGRSEYYPYYHCRPGLPCRERLEGQARGTVRRRTRPAAADSRLHATTQGVRAAHLEGAKGSRPRGARQSRARREGDSRKARPLGRSIPVRTLDRHRDVRPPRRETARGAYARADRASLRPAL